VATPVGPVAPDPDDPDLWTEWGDEGADDDIGPSRFGWPVRLVAAIAILGIVLLLVL
jgi:hypothetical protein